MERRLDIQVKVVLEEAKQFCRKRQRFARNDKALSETTKLFWSWACEIDKILETSLRQGEESEIQNTQQDQKHPRHDHYLEANSLNCGL
jgi:hypothetical protein